jgi:hypothetical protein
MRFSQTDMFANDRMNTRVKVVSHLRSNILQFRNGRGDTNKNKTVIEKAANMFIGINMPASQSVKNSLNEKNYRNAVNFMLKGANLVEEFDYSDFDSDVALSEKMGIIDPLPVKRAATKLIVDSKKSYTKKHLDETVAKAISKALGQKGSCKDAISLVIGMVREELDAMVSDPTTAPNTGDVVPPNVDSEVPSDKTPEKGTSNEDDPLASKNPADQNASTTPTAAQTEAADDDSDDEDSSDDDSEEDITIGDDEDDEEDENEGEEDILTYVSEIMDIANTFIDNSCDEGAKKKILDSVNALNAAIDKNDPTARTILSEIVSILSSIEEELEDEVPATISGSQGDPDNATQDRKGEVQDPIPTDNLHQEDKEAMKDVLGAEAEDSDDSAMSQDIQKPKPNVDFQN